MPNPGQANNPAGINSFSGPLGETEPAYGAVEQAKVLDRAVPVGSPNPDSIPKRAQRRAVAGRGGATAPAPSDIHPGGMIAADSDVQQQVFWQAVLADPGASPLARQYAEQALGSVG